MLYWTYFDNKGVHEGYTGELEYLKKINPKGPFIASGSVFRGKIIIINTNGTFEIH